MRSGRLRTGLLVLVAWVVGMAGTLTVQETVAAFSDTTANSGNTFTAAASFCGSGSQTLLATEDARIHQLNPSTNYGTSAALQVRTAFLGNRRTLVSFALPPLPSGCTLTSATLRLFATSASGSRTIDVYRANAAWTEAAVTWGTQPGMTGPAVGAPSASGWITWDVTAHVSAMYSGSNHGFVLRDRSESSFSQQNQTYRSTEAGETPPELVVTLG
jgi:large repetitive protein